MRSAMRSGHARLHSVFLVLALAAMLLVILGPVCGEIAAAVFPGQAPAKHLSKAVGTGLSGAGVEPCCDSLQPAALPETPGWILLTGGMLVAGLALFGYRNFPSPDSRLIGRSGALPSKSFHVRSARILR